MSLTDEENKKIDEAKRLAKLGFSTHHLTEYFIECIERLQKESERQKRAIEKLKEQRDENIYGHGLKANGDYVNEYEKEITDILAGKDEG